MSPKTKPQKTQSKLRPEGRKLDCLNHVSTLLTLRPRMRRSHQWGVCMGAEVHRFLQFLRFQLVRFLQFQAKARFVQQPHEPT